MKVERHRIFKISYTDGSGSQMALVNAPNAIVAEDVLKREMGDGISVTGVIEGGYIGKNRQIVWEGGDSGGSGGTPINVPTKLSQLTNDTGFITSATDNLENYYKKAEVYNKSEVYTKNETYTKDEVDEAIAGIDRLRKRVVPALPATGEEDVIYFVPSDDPQSNDVMSEYIWIGGAWEHVGDVRIDFDIDDELSGSSENPVQNKAVKAAVDLKADDIDINGKESYIDNKELVDTIITRGMSTNPGTLEVSVKSIGGLTINQPACLYVQFQEGNTHTKFKFYIDGENVLIPKNARYSLDNEPQVLIEPAYMPWAAILKIKLTGRIIEDGGRTWEVKDAYSATLYKAYKVARVTEVVDEDLNFAKVALTGQYGHLLNAPAIPANVSELNNDAGYITDSGFDGDFYADAAWKVVRYDADDAEKKWAFIDFVAGAPKASGHPPFIEGRYYGCMGDSDMNEPVPLKYEDGKFVFKDAGGQETIWLLLERNGNQYTLRTTEESEVYGSHWWFGAASKKLSEDMFDDSFLKQADWEVEDTKNVTYIRNKPDLSMKADLESIEGFEELAVLELVDDPSAYYGKASASPLMPDAVKVGDRLQFKFREYDLGGNPIEVPYADIPPYDVTAEMTAEDDGGGGWIAFFANSKGGEASIHYSNGRYKADMFYRGTLYKKGVLGKKLKLEQLPDMKTVNGESTIGKGDIAITAKVFKDVDSLPATDIDNNSIYRKTDRWHEYDGERVDYDSLEWFGMGQDTLNMAADNTNGLSIEYQGGSEQYAWADVTDSIVQSLMARRLVSAKPSSEDAEFFSTAADTYGPKDGLVEVEGGYLLYHNPTGTEDGYVEIGGGGSFAVDDVTTEMADNKIQANAIITVNKLPTTDIKAKTIYRMLVDKYYEDGNVLPARPNGYVSIRPAIVIIDENGITDNGTFYAWADINDDKMDFWVIRRQISQVYAADLMTNSTCFKTAANHYVYKDHVTKGQVYELYHNPTATANAFIKIGGEEGGSVEVDDVTMKKVDGKLQSNAIIEVQTLPSTGYKQNSLYRMLDTATQTFKKYYYNASADPLPETPVFYKGDGEHVTFGADNVTVNGSTTSYTMLSEIQMTLWINSGWVEVVTDFAQAGAFKMPTSLVAYDSITKLTEEDYVVTAEMDKVFKRIQGGWECISYIQLDKEQYDILSEAQKNDGTLYIVNDEEE